MGLLPQVGLPSTYEDFLKFEKESFGPDSFVYGPVTYMTEAQEICAIDPQSRACAHARFFEQPGEIPRKHQEIYKKYPERSYRSWDMKHVFSYSPQFPMSTEICVADNEAIQFSTNDAQQREMVLAMGRKISKSQHTVKVLFLYGPYPITKYSNSVAVPSSDIRFIIEDCKFVGTPEEYLADTSCK
jgi:hypothetical protein